MKILVAITLTDAQVKKIGWCLGNYSDELTDETECKQWIDSFLLDTLGALPDPPE